MKTHIQIVLAFSFCFLFLVNMSIWAQPVITALNGTPGTCAADCKLEVIASGGTGTVKYGLIAPSVELRSAQSSNVFEDLPAGSYTVAVYDDVTGNASPTTLVTTLTTPYLTLTLDAITKVEPPSSCAKGSITVSVKDGKAPFSYTYTADIGGVPVTDTVLSNLRSYTFTDLYRGANYSISVTDNCNASAPGTISFTGAAYAPLLVTPPTQVILSYEEHVLSAGPACTDYKISFNYPGTEPIFLEHPTIPATQYRVEYPAESGSGTPWSGDSRHYDITTFDATKRTFRFQMKNPCTGEIVSSKTYTIPWKVGILIGEECDDIPYLTSPVLLANGWGGNLFDACQASIKAINTKTGITVLDKTSANLVSDNLLPGLMRGETYKLNVKQGLFDTTFVYTVPRYFHEYKILCLNNPYIDRYGQTDYYCGYDYQVMDLKPCLSHFPVRLSIIQKSNGVVIQDFNYSNDFSPKISNLRPNTLYLFCISDEGGTRDTTEYLTKSTEQFYKAQVYGTQNLMSELHTDVLNTICSLDKGYIGAIQYPGTTVKYNIIEGPEQVNVPRTKSLASTVTAENLLLWQDLSFGTYKVEVDYMCGISVKDTITIVLDQKYKDLAVEAILYTGNTCAVTYVRGRPYAIDQSGNKQYLYRSYTAVLKNGAGAVIATQSHSNMYTEYDFKEVLSENVTYTIEIWFNHPNGQTNLCTQTNFQFQAYVAPQIKKEESGGVICSGNVGNLTIKPLQGSPTYTYQYKKSVESVWVPAIPQLENVITNVPLGTYDIRLIDRCGAFVQEQVKVYNPAAQSVIKATGVYDHVDNTAKTCPGNTVVLSIDLVGAITNIEWTDPLGNKIDAATLTINNFAPSDVGKYTVTFRTALGDCQAISDLTIYAGRARAEDINYIPLTKICNSGSTSLQVSGKGVPGALRFRWYSDVNLTPASFLYEGPNFNTPVLTALTTYYVTLSSEFLCENLPGTAAALTVDIKPLPSILISGLPSICTGTSTNLLASGADTYIWSTGELTDQISVTPQANQIYTVKGTLGGCENSADFTMTVKETPRLIVNAPTAVCYNTPVTLEILNDEPGVSYTWEHDGSHALSITETLTASKIYKVTALGSNGCETKKEIQITVHSLPIINILANPNSCKGELYTLIASGASTYLWSTGATTASMTDSPIINTLYSVIGKDENGCESSKNYGVVIRELPVISIVATPSNICLGASVNLKASGAANYSWDHGKNGMSITESPNTTTLYTVTGIDEYGCKANTSQNVVVNSLPEVKIDAAKDAICLGDSVQLNALGAHDYVWSTSSTDTNETLMVHPTADKIYTVTGTDANGCKATATHKITVTRSPILNIVGSNRICENEDLSLTVTGADTYVWEGGVAGPSFTETPSVGNHIYTVEGTDTLGCTSIKTYNVTVNPVPVLDISALDEVCSGTNVSLQVSGAKSYVWNTGQTGAAITDIPTTDKTYTVEGTNVTGCKATALHNLTVNPLPTLILAADTNICAGSTLILSVVGADTYSWDNGLTTSSTSSITDTPNADKSYSVIGTDIKGCVSKAHHTVIVHAKPVITIIAKTAICKNDNLNLLASGATSFIWAGGGNTPSINVKPLADTTYSVEGTDAFGCTSTKTHSVVVNPLPVVSISAPIEACSGSNVNLKVTGATQYVWDNGQSGTAITVMPTVNTSYSVEGTDGNGCKATDSYNLAVNPLPILILTADTNICAGSTLNLSVVGADTYAWNNGLTTSVITDIPVADKSYWVIGTDGKGCKSRKDHKVTVRVLPTIKIAGKNTICENDNLNLLASGATSYIWEGGGNTASIDVTPLVDTTYTVKGTDDYGCIGELTHKVVVNGLPNLNIVAIDEVCSGTNISLQVSGAKQYVWNNIKNGPIITDTPTTDTSYTVEGIDVNGCKATATHNLAVNPLPTLILTAENDICAGLPLNLSVVGADTYTWNNGLTTSNITDIPLADKSYWVIGTDVKGCQSRKDHKVTVRVLPTIKIVGKNAICKNDNLNLLASGATTYIWDGGGNTASINVTPLSDTTFTVKGIDNYGCIGELTHKVVVNSLPTLTFVALDEVCSGTNISLQVSGAKQYVWNNIKNGPVITDTPTTDTSYTVEGIDVNGCKATATLTLTVNPLPTLILTAENDICAGLPLNLSVVGADTYTWNNGLTTSNITDIPLADKSYWVIGTDAKGCQSRKDHKVTVRVLPTIKIVGKNAICKNDNLNLLASGATTYIWDGGGNTASINVTPLSDTTFTVKGIDNYGCIGELTHKVVVNSLPTLTFAALDEVCSGTNISLQVSGAKQYVWNNIKIGPVITDTPTTDTSYTVEGIDVNGCKATATHNLAVNPLPTLILMADKDICFGLPLKLSVVGADTYSWDNGLTTSVITDIPKTDKSYWVIGTDVKGCQSRKDHKVTVRSLPIINIGGNKAICKNDQLNLLASGATTYIWEGGGNTANINVTPLVDTTYTVKGTDDFGCIGTKTHSVVVNSLPTLTITAIGETCSGTNISLQVSGAKQYLWDNGKTGSVITDIALNDLTYSVEGTDNNGCKATLSHHLTVNPLPTLIITAFDAICVGDALQLEVNGANKYVWSTGGTTSVITDSPKNNITYSVIGEDVNGCKNTQTHPVIVHKLPKLVLQAPKAICLGADALLHVSGAVEYLWQDGQVGADIVDTPLSDKMYSVEGTDMNGCKSTTMHNLKINALPNVRIAALNELCKGDKITLQASGALQYTWQDGKQGALVVDIPDLDKIYTVEGVDNNGCKSPAQHSVIVNPLPELKINALDALCKGQTITLSVIGAATYKWTTGETTATISDTPLHDRTYAVYGTDTNKCVSLQTHNLRIKPLPDARITAVNNLCYGDTTNLLGTGGDTYTWNTGEITSSIIVQPSHDSTYQLTVGLEGCEVSTSHRLTVHALPKISIAGDTAVCTGVDILLKSSTIGLLDHIWYFKNNEINQGPFIKFIPKETGNYEVRAKDIRGCMGKELHFVEVLQPAQIEIMGDSVVCKGNQLILEAMGAETYTWNTGHIGNLLTTYPVAHEVYSVIANDINNCKITKSIDVDVVPYPKANMTISTNHVNAKHPSVDFSSTNTEDDFVWNMGDGYYSTSKDFTYAFNTNYLKDYKVSLIVKNEYACPDTVHRIISVDLYVPNTFTPNGDGLNDVFMEQCDVCRKIQIFDRQGVLLHDKPEGWDGMYKGQFAGNDTYFYVITVEREDQKMEDLKGYITIIGKK